MQRLTFVEAGRGKGALSILCIGAHCDDIEIGCGATLMRLAAERSLEVTWVVLSSNAKRAAETRRSAELFLAGAKRKHVLVQKFRDGFLPAEWKKAKEFFETLKALPTPDVIFTHEGADRHQDHRIVSELTWNTFRNHLILEYEIPKYDGGLGQPNVFVPVSRAIAEQKTAHLLKCYASQASKGWFTSDTFMALMRLRGIESGATEGFAEAFHGRKICI